MTAGGTPDWTALVIGGGAAVGKSSAARAIADVYHISILPADAIWIALKAATDPHSHPELHYFDPTDEDLKLPPQELCDRHIESSVAIGRAMDPVIEHFVLERSPVIVEGAWLTPSAAKRWTAQNQSVRALFIHESEQERILDSMVVRSRRQSPTRRQKILAEVCWQYGNWIRRQALSENLPVIESSPRGTLTDRILTSA